MATGDPVNDLFASWKGISIPQAGYVYTPYTPTWSNYQVQFISQIGSTKGVFQQASGSSAHSSYHSIFDHIIDEAWDDEPQEPVLLSRSKYDNKIEALAFTDDIVLVRTEKRLCSGERKTVEEKFKQLSKTKAPLVLFLTGEECVRDVSEEEMKRHGWQRIKKQKSFSPGEIPPRRLDI